MIRRPSTPSKQGAVQVVTAPPVTLVAPVLRRYEWLAQVQKIIDSHKADPAGISLHGYPAPIPNPIYLYRFFGTLYPVGPRPVCGPEGRYVLTTNGQRLPHRQAPVFPWAVEAWRDPLDELRPRLFKARLTILQNSLHRLAGGKVDIPKVVLDTLTRAIGNPKNLALLEKIHAKLRRSAPQQFRYPALLGMLEFTALLDYEMANGSGEVFRAKFEKDFIGSTLAPYLRLDPSSSPDTVKSVDHAYKIWHMGWQEHRHKHVAGTLKILGLGLKSLSQLFEDDGPPYLSGTAACYPTLKITNDCRRISCDNKLIAELTPETAMIFKILLEDHMAGGTGLSFQDVLSKAQLHLQGWVKRSSDVLKKSDARKVIMSDKKRSAILQIVPMLRTPAEAIVWDRVPTAILGRAKFLLPLAIDNK